MIGQRVWIGNFMEFYTQKSSENPSPPQDYSPYKMGPQDS